MLCHHLSVVSQQSADRLRGVCDWRDAAQVCDLGEPGRTGHQGRVLQDLWWDDFLCTEMLFYNKTPVNIHLS